MIKQYVKLWVLPVCLYSTAAMAQLPPVNFTGATNVCDNTPWKLVFYDGFDGTAIDADKWYTFNTNNAGSDDNWCEARIGYPGNESIHRDENVVVSGGTAKLKIKQQTNTWQCASCNTADCQPVRGNVPFTSNYTSGYISSTAKYNNGRIEARLKMPLFKYSWATCWTMYLSDVNEIDFAESWGGTNGHSWPYLGDRPRNTYNLHAWAPRNDTLGLPDVMSIGNAYPNQSWWDWITARHHHQEDWHTYVCEWDTASIKIYLDGSLVNTTWKYYKKQLVPYHTSSNRIIWYTVKTPSGCTPAAGAWYVTEGFPYNNTSDSRLIFSAGTTHSGKVLPKDGELGQMEIDYVKVYQRHPEQEGHTEICKGPLPVITGPGTLCGKTVYGVSPATTGGTWSSGNGAVFLAGQSLGGSTVVVEDNPNSPYGSTVLSYTYTPLGCPPVTISKTINTETAVTHVIVSRNWYWQMEDFVFLANPVIPGATYSWRVWYGFSSSRLNFYTASGPYIVTPKMWHQGILPYYVKWELSITTSCGTRKLTGVKSNTSYMAPSISNPETFMEKDSSAFYLEARFTEGDSIKYEETVAAAVAAKFVEDPEDAAAVAEMIDKVRLEALEPYLYFGDEDSLKAGDEEKGMLPSGSSPARSDLSGVYPNPASRMLFIRPSDKFEPDKAVRFKMFSMPGQVVLEGILENTIDISPLPAGSYVIELSQDANTEHLKLLKE